jgi:pyridoxine kinase
LKILSIQSWVASGHVGNAAAVFALQRLGAEVLAIHTVQFSNHPGHGAFTGRALPAPEIAALVDGLAAHGALRHCDAVLTGYLGDAALGPVVLDAVAQMRAHHPAALWCCDPVMGDDGQLYVRPGIPEFFAGAALAQADIVTPNQFELGVLTGAHTGSQTGSQPAILAAAAALRDRLRPAGPRIVLVTSLAIAETPADSLDMLLCWDGGSAWLRTTLLPAKFSGAGDTLTALFLFHVLAGLPPPDAAERAAASMAGLLRRTFDAASPELLIVAAQDEFVSPSLRVERRAYEA